MVNSKQVTAVAVHSDSMMRHKLQRKGGLFIYERLTEEVYIATDGPDHGADVCRNDNGRG